METSWQPDRGRGVFETLLVIDGAPVEIEAHIRRLSRSLEEVYSLELPAEVRERGMRAAGRIRLGRLRLMLTPTDEGLRLDLLAGEVKPEVVFPSRGVNLHTHPVSGGLGAHKWVDRKGINRPDAGKSGALIVDEGEVLEAGWANVFAVRGGTLFTPPLDGRLLPGTTRAALLELAAEEGIESREQTLYPGDLFSADEVFLSGSIRGIEAALELDEEALAGCGPVSRRLAAALRRRWGLADGLDAHQDSATAPQPDQLSQ